MRIVTAREQIAMLTPWLRTAQDWMAGVPGDPLDPETTIHSFLLGPEDAYVGWRSGD